MSEERSRKKMLLHICCAGCGAYVSDLLRQDFDLSLFYFNPNIDSREENDRRLVDVRRISELYKTELVTVDYDHQSWLDKISGLEQEKERGVRCFLCYEIRMRRAFDYALKNGFDIFSTTLTVSPHKVAERIIQIGNELVKDSEIDFLDWDFKKKNGFKKSLDISKELDIYRQNYCGCEFSRR